MNTYVNGSLKEAVEPDEPGVTTYKGIELPVHLISKAKNLISRHPVLKRQMSWEQVALILTVAEEAKVTHE